MNGMRMLRSGVLAGALVVGLAACGGGGSAEQGATAGLGSGSGKISVWAHQGQPAEVTVLKEAVARFNAAQREVEVELRFVPEADYVKTITTTDPDELPDVLEYDGPLMASLVYAQKLSPVDALVSAQSVQNQTSSVKAQNTYPGDNKLYGVSQFDSGLGIYGSKKLLAAAGVAYPRGVEDAWTADDFQTALKKLSAKDADHKVLDIKENYGGEWPTYGFLPIVYSSGQQVVKDNQAEGSLNHPAVVEAVEQFAGWRQFVDPNTDDKAFTQGRVALSWVGHWAYNDYKKALGEDLVVLPLPDFGAGTKSGQGSWAWGVSPKSQNGKAAGKFLDFLVSDEVVSQMTEANAAPPGTTTVSQQSPLYKAGGPLELFARQLEMTCGDKPPTPQCVATPRPITPAYPVISQQFSKAFFGAYNGGDAKSLLGNAVKAIDLDYKDNDNYGLR